MDVFTPAHQGLYDALSGLHIPDRELLLMHHHLAAADHDKDLERPLPDEVETYVYTDAYAPADGMFEAFEAALGNIPDLDKVREALPVFAALVTARGLTPLPVGG